MKIPMDTVDLRCPRSKVTSPVKSCQILLPPTGINFSSELTQHFPCILIITFLFIDISIALFYSCFHISLVAPIIFISAYKCFFSPLSSTLPQSHCLKAYLTHFCIPSANTVSIHTEMMSNKWLLNKSSYDNSAILI